MTRVLASMYVIGAATFVVASLYVTGAFTTGDVTGIFGIS